MAPGALIDSINRGSFSRRLWFLHGRLIAGTALGALAFLASSMVPMRLSTRLLSCWDLGVATYLALAVHMMAKASIEKIKQRAAVYDEGSLIVLALTTTAALASLVAVLVELSHRPGPQHPYESLDVILGVATISLSWAFMHTIFALRYAHEYYGEGRDERMGGMMFPDEDDPDYLDFVYYSLVIAMTAQVSDVQITSAIIRRQTTMHSIVSFFFNVAVFALAINLISNLLQAS